MAKTIAIAVAISLLSIAPLATFAQSIPSITIPSLPYQWLLFVIIAALSIVVLLMTTNQLQRPSSFASLPVYLFFSLTLFVIFDILAISFIPTAFFGGDSFPISTGPFTNPQNQTQWVLSIGGNIHNPNTSGLQIPIYVIIAGILGAYIRYLYIGISEFKESFQQKLNSFEERYRDYFKALDEYSAHTKKIINTWGVPIKPDTKHSSTESRPRTGRLGIFERIRGVQVSLPFVDFEIADNRPILSSSLNDPSRLEYGIEVTCLEDDPPQGIPIDGYNIPNPKFDNKKPESKENPMELDVNYKRRRRYLWSKISEAETNFKKGRFIVGIEITTHVLKTVGSFFLAPLLAVLAWLLLSIAGTGDVLTFALVSFAIGLTTKIIITRVMNFVGEHIADETPAASTTPAATRTDTSTTQAPSIVIDPNQARAGQLLSVEGNGFRANSRITLEYAGNGGAANNTIQAFRETFQSSSEGKFGFRFWLSPSLLAGTYNLSVKDDNSESASGRFTVS
jgi:hypothetical protein